MHNKSPLPLLPPPRLHLLLINLQIPPRNLLRKLHLRNRNRSPLPCPRARSERDSWRTRNTLLIRSLLILKFLGLFDKVFVVERAAWDAGTAAHSCGFCVWRKGLGDGPGGGIGGDLTGFLGRDVEW